LSRCISILKAGEGMEDTAPGKGSNEHPDLKGRENVNPNRDPGKD